MIKSLKKRNKIYVRDPNRLERLICAERQYFHHPQNWTDPHARSRGKQKRGGNRRNEKEGRGLVRRTSAWSSVLSDYPLGSMVIKVRCSILVYSIGLVIFFLRKIFHFIYVDFLDNCVS